MTCVKSSWFEGSIAFWADAGRDGFSIERMEMCQSHHAYWRVVNRKAVADVSSPKTLAILVRNRFGAVCRVPGLLSTVEKLRPAYLWFGTDFALSDTLDCRFSDHIELSSCYRPHAARSIQSKRSFQKR